MIIHLIYFYTLNKNPNNTLVSFVLSYTFHFQDKLKEEVENSAKQCHQSLFILDDIDKMPYGILDVLKPYLKGYRHLEGTDYRQLLFLFLRQTICNLFDNGIIYIYLINVLRITFARVSVYIYIYNNLHCLRPETDFNTKKLVIYIVL